MDALALLDHDGIYLTVGSERIRLTPGGVALVGAAAAGGALDEQTAGALATELQEPPEPLLELAARLRAWPDHESVHVSSLDRPYAFEPPATHTLDPDVPIQAPIPLPMLVTPAGFLAWPPGRSTPELLSAEEVALLTRFALPQRPATAFGEAIPDHARAFLGRQLESGLLQRPASFEPRTGTAAGKTALSPITERTKQLVRQQRDILDARAARNGRVPVYPVNRSQQIGPPLALGLILAHAAGYDGGRLNATYDFVPDWTIRPKAVARLTADGPAVFLCSDYVWSAESNDELARRVKEVSPGSLVVRGGPNAPKYAGDRDRFFTEHPEIDVVINGEGEVTVAEMLDALDGRLDDLSPLADVPGLTYRPGPGQAPVTTAERPRMAELEQVPSPYITGLFDAFLGAADLVIIETNRGCPYGCTFCDWGSSTLSRYRKFEMDRIAAEIDWAARSGAKTVIVGDSNFGIFERDAEIAELFVAARATYGTPQEVWFSYAKNTTKHVEKIVQTMVDGGIFGQATISIQSFDEGTLDIVNRKNIKTAKYDDLARTFRDKQLPVYTELMIGLPGSTVSSLTTDLQHCIERDVMVRSHPTRLLVNSPMNDPAYRALHRIEVDDMDMLTSTATYTADDRAQMDRIVARYHASESYGLLRQVNRWVHHRTGEREMDVLEAIGKAADAEPERFPLVSWALGNFLAHTVAPGSWPLFYDEIEVLLRETYGPDLVDEEWPTVRAVQLALMPDRGRVFPDVVELPHDFVAWSWAFSDARSEGLEPVGAVPRLASYGPGRLEVTDPNQVCTHQMGAWHFTADFHHWELASPVARHLGGRWAPATA